MIVRGDPSLQKKKYVLLREYNESHPTSETRSYIDLARWREDHAPSFKERATTDATADIFLQLAIICM